MSAIGKGDWFQCIRTDTAEGDPYSVFAGSTYYCEALIHGAAHGGPCPFCGGSPRIGLVLSGVTPRGQGWCPCNFRPMGGGGAAVVEKAREPALV